MFIVNQLLKYWTIQLKHLHTLQHDNIINGLQLVMPTFSFTEVLKIVLEIIVNKFYEAMQILVFYLKHGDSIVLWNHIPKIPF